MRHQLIRRSLALTLIAGLAGPALGARCNGKIGSRGVIADPAGPARQDLPIREITLLRSGVGQFVRAGTIEGDGLVQLRFQTEQINDILKSMYLLDLDGGRIGEVSYASREPLERRLASFAIDIADMPSLPELLSRLRGAPVALATLDGRVEGTILSVETRSVAEGDVVIDAPFVTLFTGSGMRSIRIDLVQSFEILDRQLASELERALGVLAEHRADTLKSVDIALSGEGSRRVVVGYVHEMPVWKTSYRLILNEAGEPTLQGWAIVENTTDEDWTDVRLSLVAGQPVGFRMDLYQPLYNPRPEIPVPIVVAAKPKVYEESFAGQELRRDASKRDDSPGRSARLQSAPAAAAMESMEYGLAAADMVTGAAQARAQASEVGEVFQYRLDTPISIERQQSAMLPIITSAIEGRRVSVYNPDDLRDHPMRGVEITNDTQLQFLPGPVAVYDQTAFAGDAQIGHVSPGDERLLAYAVDLDVDAQFDRRFEADIQQLRIVNGAFEQTTLRRQSSNYQFRNRDTDDVRTVLVEHPRMDGWELKTKQAARDAGPSVVRFEVAVPKAGTQDLEIVYQRVERQRVGFTSFELPQLIVMQRQGKVSQAVVDAIRELSRMRSELDRFEREAGAIEQQIAEIDRDQDRIRRNMGSLDRTGDLYRRYVSTLSEQETQLATLRDRLAAARASAESQRRTITSYLQNQQID